MIQREIQHAFELALQHHKAGRLREAGDLYRQILAHQSAHFGAMHYLGVIAHQSGRNDVAADLIRRAIAINPDSAEAYCNLGAALKELGDLDEAMDAYRRAIRLRADVPEVHYNLGIALRENRQLDAAIAAYQRAIALRPRYAEAHKNLSVALQEAGRLDEAIAACRAAIALSPNSAEAHANLGNVLKDSGKLNEAVAACRQAVALNPLLHGAHFNLGNALKENGQIDAAIAAWKMAISLQPNYAEAHTNLANALRDTALLDEAVAECRQAVIADPDNPAIHSNLIFALHFHGASDPAAIADEHRRWNQRHAEPLRKYFKPHSNDRNPSRRLRIGYVSPDFRQHCQSCFTVPLLSAHDRREVEVFCYSDVVRPDAITRRLQGYADTWRNIVGLADQQVADLIRSDRIDILVDLTLHMGCNRLLVFARKPAPVQVSWLGYPCSTGLDTIDYRLSDPYLDPPDATRGGPFDATQDGPFDAPQAAPLDASRGETCDATQGGPSGEDQSCFREETIRLPDTFWCYDALEDLPVSALPARNAGLVTFGCLNNFCKLNNSMLALWGKVLQRVERSRLLLLAPEGSHRQWVTEQLGREGVEPHRVQFVPFQPRRAYLELYHQIDIGLDCHPVNGHTTSLDAFWMGVPVVTLLGRTAMGRGGLCQLSNLGLPELAGQTPEQFVDIAVSLAGDLPRLEQLRSTLRGRMEQSPLMDAPKFAKNVETAYRRMWHRWCKFHSIRSSWSP